MMPIHFQPPREEPAILLAITDSELIVTTAYMKMKVVSILNINDTLPIEVLAWINLLKREDGGMAV